MRMRPIYYISLLLIICDVVRPKNLAAPLNFWNYPPDKIKEYRRDGRTCGECYFPFDHNNETHYGCFKEDDEIHYCLNRDGDSLKCPDDCPTGDVIFRFMKAVSGANNTFVIQCHAFGSPNPTATFKRDGEVIEVVEPPEDPYLTALTYNLTLTYDQDDHGEYSCVVENYFSIYDSASPPNGWRDVFDFYGQALPIAPTNFKAKINGTHALVSWDYEGPEDRVSYTVFQWPGYGMSHFEHNHIGRNYLNMRHLDPGVTYTIQVKATNNAGTGPFSEAFELTIPSDAKIEQPFNVTVKDVRYNAVDLEWEYDGNLKAESWIMFGILIEPGLKGEYESIDITSSPTSDTVYDLHPYTSYKLTVFSKPIPGPRRYAEPVYITTLPQRPYVKDFVVDEEDEFLMKLTCTATGYPRPELTWKRGERDIDSVFKPRFQVNDDGTVTSFVTLPRIRANYVTFQCIATNAAGPSKDFLFLGWEKPKDRYIADDMDDFFRNVAKIISELRMEVQNLTEENMEMKEALELMTAATETANATEIANATQELTAEISTLIEESTTEQALEQED